MSTLKRTPLFPEYKKHQAKTIDFGGWELPVQFSSIIHEHEVTRTKATIFDVSHMGEILVSGRDSLPFLQRVVTNDVSLLTHHKVQYSVMCKEDGGTIDDFLIYMLDEDEYLLVVNAANIEKDYTWLLEQKRENEDVSIVDVSEKFGLIAIQGPRAEVILQQITDEKLNGMKPFTCKSGVAIDKVSENVLISRTGYTGEDGFEIYAHPNETPNLWNQLLKVGQEYGLEPAGLGARDTLRFEAALPLYGQELSETITPIEAKIGFAVKLDKESDFIGKNALKRQKENGPRRKLVGIEMVDKGIPRTGYKVLTEGGKEIGTVTSGTKSPTLQKNIGLVLIDEPYTAIDTKLYIQVRKRTLQAKVVKTPFYRRQR